MFFKKTPSHVSIPPNQKLKLLEFRFVDLRLVELRFAELRLIKFRFAELR